MKEEENLEGEKVWLDGRSPKPGFREKLPFCHRSSTGILLGLRHFTRRKGGKGIIC